MARTVTLYFGTFVIDWEDFLLDQDCANYEKALSRPLYGSRSETNNTLISIGSDIAGAIPPVLHLEKNIKSQGARLIDLLAATHTCAATDPREKIFALLGMAKEEAGL